MRSPREVALEAGQRRLDELCIRTGTRAVVMVDGALLAAKVGRVGERVDEVEVEVFTGTAWPAFVMTEEDYLRAHRGEEDDVWLEVATGPVSYRLVPVTPDDCR